MLSNELKEKGYSLHDVSESDWTDYFSIKRECFSTYVDKYYGGWDDTQQRELNSVSFNNMLEYSYFKKLARINTLGFLAYNIENDKIESVSIQLSKSARNRGIGSCFLKYITQLSIDIGKPVFLKVFRTNPAKDLYSRFGFEVYSETHSHLLMKYN